MKYQIAVFSADEAFGRMLELEFFIYQKSVLRARHTASDFYADTVLLDLDTCRVPDEQCCRRVIGLTVDSSLIGEGTLRKCSMIFHRPFEMRLLRQEVLADGEMWQSPRTSLGSVDLTLELRGTTLLVGGAELSLTPNESRIMRLLIDRRRQVVTRQEIAQVIGQSDANKTDVYICYLRRKLEDALGYRVIQTVRGRGYMVQ